MAKAKIEIRYQGLEGKAVYLGHYNGDTTYLSDTAQSNSQGEFVFEGNKPLTYRGIYFLAINSPKGVASQFQFVVGDTQHFSMITNREDFVKNMRVVGDVDNNLFFENIHCIKTSRG